MDRSPIFELGIIVFILLLFAALLYLQPAYYGYVLMEDMPPEWFGFLMLVAGILYWGKAARRRYLSHSLFGSLFCISLAFLCLFVAGEEISWGQRLFGFTPPEYFLHRNVQHEVTIHNLALAWMQPRRIAVVFMIAYGLLLPLARYTLPPVRHLLRRRDIPVPAMGPAFGFGMSAYLMTMPVTMTDDEVGEVIFAFCLAVVAIRAAMPRSRVYTSLKRIVYGAAIFSCLISALCFLNPQHREQVVNVGHLQAGLAYEGRGMVWHAAREYEQLAEYWETHWNLWIRVMAMYYESHDIGRAYRVGIQTLRVNNRLWRIYELLAGIGRLTGREGEVSSAFRRVLIDEPYNIFALHGMDTLEGNRWLYSRARRRTVDFR